MAVVYAILQGFCAGFAGAYHFGVEEDQGRYQRHCYDDDDPYGGGFFWISFHVVLEI
jgi:hypothetical protein